MTPDPLPAGAAENPTMAPAAAPQPAVAPAVPGYALLAELGRGGMGVVYQARQLGLNRVVALKMILAGGHAGEAERTRFRTEAEAIARLKHPHIVEIHELGEHEGRPFFALEYCAGGSLEQKIKGTPLPPREAARLVEVLAGAMHAAHGQGVVHRDLKPANVLLTADGQPKITDFGLAKRVRGEPGASATGGLTLSGAILGTPSYMAPEQAEGKKEVGPAADTYALGAILYELLTGRPPFKAATAVETLMQVAADEPVPPSRLQPKTPRDLETICVKCLQKNPGQRYATAAELADDLRRFQAGEPIRARPVGVLERGWRWCRRNPAVAATTALATLAVVAAVVITVAAAIREGENAALIARQELEGLRKEREREQQEREKDRERLRDSFIEQARAERLAGNRARSLDALRQAADIRRDDALRLEASATITRPGLCALPEKIPLESNYVNRSGLSSDPVASSDGKLLAVAGRIDIDPFHMEGIQVRELPSGKLRGRRSGFYLPITFRPGTAQLAMARFQENEYYVSLWDPDTDKEVGKYAGWIAAFSTDGSHLLTQDRKVKKKTAVRVWDLMSGREAKPPARGAFQAFLSEHEALLLDEGRYRVWDCRAGQNRLVTPDGLNAVGYAASAKLGALRGRLAEEPHAALHVWDLAVGKRVGVLAGLSALPDVATFSPNGHYLVFDDPAARGESLRLWDLRTGQFGNRLMAPRGLHCLTDPVRSPDPHLGPGFGDAGLWRSFNPDGSLLASVVTDKRQSFLCVWDTDNGNILATLPGVRAHWWSDDGQSLIVPVEGKYVSRYEVKRPAPSYSLGAAVKSLSLNKDGSRLAVNDRICAVVREGHGPELMSWAVPAKGWTPQFVGKEEVWAVTWRKSMPTIPRVGLELRQLAPVRRKVVLPEVPFPEAQKLAEKLMIDEAKRKGPLRWYAVVGTRRWALAPEGGLLFREGILGCVGYTIDPKGIVESWPSASVTAGAPVLELWNYQEGKRLTLVRESARCIKFSPDARRAATGTESGDLKIWNVAMGKVEKVLHSQGANKLEFSPDGRRLLAVKAGAGATLYEIDSAREVQTWKVHKGDWQAFALNPDGTLVASGGEDKLIHLWDAASGRELARWQGHDGGATALLFSPDGRTLYSGGQEGILKLWNLPFLRRELKALKMDW